MQPDATFWDNLAERYAAQPVQNSDAFEHKIEITRAQMGPDSVVLDIGCWTGSLALRLADAGAQVHGLDLSPRDGTEADGMRRGLSLKTRALLSVFFLLSTASLAVATPLGDAPGGSENLNAPQAPATAEFSTSLHMSPLTLLGGFAGSVEQQIVGPHALQLGAGWTGYGISQGVEVGLNYRFYLGAPLDSAFVGAFALYGDIEAQGEFGESSTTYEIAVEFFRLGLNYGRRWVFSSGFSILLRGGYGYPIRTVDWRAPGPSQAERRDFESTLGWLLGVDAEFSLGWTF